MTPDFAVRRRWARRPSILVLAALMAAGFALARPDPATTLDLLSDGWPRAFFFRACEGRAANPRISYDLWDRTFSRLMGIEGKALDEEVPGRSRRNIQFFSRFKQLHPRQLVLLHYNGNARDPRDAGDKFFAGHWVYFTGCKITRDLPAEEGVSELHVENPDLFRTNIGRYGDKNEDLGLCLLDDQGRPDWRYAEQVELLSKDAARKVLRIRRGCFGTRPRAFPAGRSYVAAHVTEGPWGRQSHLLWFYNFSTRCPCDEQGRQCRDVLVEELASYFAPGGRLQDFDGVEFDVLFYQRWKTGLVGRRGIDTDADGKADGGFWQGKNVYGIGVYEFARRLREQVGKQVLLLADGASPGSQRCFGQLNGIESEGWPNLSDWDFKDWSGGLNRHRFWKAHAYAPAFSYVNHKYIQGREGHLPHLPFSRHRLALAAAQMMDAAVCYSFPPPAEPGALFPIWDELWGGQRKNPGWLGKPLGPARCLAREAPDLLDGAGRQWPAGFVKRWEGDRTSVIRDGGALKLQGEAGTDAVRATLKAVPCRGEDLYVVGKLRAAPRRGYPAQLPRLAWLGVVKPETELVRRYPPPRTGMCRRGGRDEPIAPDSGAQVTWKPVWTAGGETREAYFCHPPYRGGRPGYVYWERDVTVPPHGRLKFAIAMGKLSPERSDGVEFRVTGRPIGSTGQAEVVFDKLYNEYRWEDEEVSLERWAGERVTLRFIADCGPKDDSTTDHAAWADVRLVQPDKPERRVKTERHMSFVAPQSFEATFYFRPVMVPAVDLALEVEGREPVWVESITIHAAPDVQVREFEHGVVLANPSLHEVTFDLARLFPGKTFRRLEGSPSQDPQTNNGQAVGGQIRLGERDGLFLVRD